MTLVDTEAARPNGSAATSAMMPPGEADPTPAEEPNATEAEAGTDASQAAGAAPSTQANADVYVLRPRDRRRFRIVPNFARTSRQVLDLDAVAALKAEARREVEGTTLSLYEIARRMDIATSTLSRWKAEEDWVRPDGAPTQPNFGGKARPRSETPEARRRDMIGKLYRVFVRQAGDLEARAAKPGASTDEKDARTLSVLAKTLETLIALDRDDGAKATKPESVDRADYRAELARTLSRWAEEGSRSGATESPPV